MTDLSSLSYLTVLGERPELTGARKLAVGSGLSLFDQGAGQTITLELNDLLTSVAKITTPGILGTKDGKTVSSISLFTSPTIAVQTDSNMNFTLSVKEKTSVQKINVLSSGTLTGSASDIQFNQGKGVTVNTAVNDGVAQVSLAVETAESKAKYIVQTPHTDLPNAQALDVLSPGLLKTDEAGVVSIAKKGVDYAEFNQQLDDISKLAPEYGSIMVGNDETFTTIIPSAPYSFLQTNEDNMPFWGNKFETVAPVHAPFLVFTESEELTDVQNLGDLQSGILYSEVTGGSARIRTAVAGEDFVSTQSVIGIAHGGTGVSSKEDAFNALYPTSAKGSLVFKDEANVSVLPIGAAGQQLVAGSNQKPVWQDPNVEYRGYPLFTRSNIDLPNSQNMAGIPAGLLKNTVAQNEHGVAVSTLVQAVAGVDYYDPTSSVIGIAHGGTGATTKEDAFLAINPLKVTGDILYQSSIGPKNLAIGTANQVLSNNGNVPVWKTIQAATGTAADSESFVVSKASAALPNAQNLGILEDGLLWNTTTAGKSILSKYKSASGNGKLLVLNESGVSEIALPTDLQTGDMAMLVFGYGDTLPKWEIMSDPAMLSLKKSRRPKS